VLEFATTTIIHHADRLEELVVFVAQHDEYELHPSDVSVVFDTMAAQEMSELFEMREDVDLRFLCGQIVMNQMLLETIDDVLMVEVEDPEVMTLIEHTRPIAQAHLVKAKDLAADLSGETWEAACFRG
jgi:hypothetical protein